MLTKQLADFLKGLSIAGAGSSKKSWKLELDLEGHLQQGVRDYSENLETFPSPACDSH